MSAERLFSPRNPWFAIPVAITVTIAAGAILAGFVWFPALQGAPDIWGAICSAAGLFTPAPDAAPVGPAGPVTQVVLTQTSWGRRDPEAIGRGATLALRCSMCHGSIGLSEANSPNLAGQYAPALYKQLADFKSGARVSAVMSPIMAPLTDDDMRDLAAYYAYLPRLSSTPGHGEPPRIVESGAPMRNIAPCGACHGELASKAGAAWLEGQPEAYLIAQLRAFRDGGRHNDIYAQMRTIVRRMSPQEMGQAASYYANQP